MKFDDALEHLYCGAYVKRKEWNNNKFVKTRDDIVSCLVDENDKRYFVDEDDYSCEWEVYNDSQRPFEEETPERQVYLTKLNISSLSRYYGKQLRLLFELYAENYNSIPEWTYESTLKYYIKYSHTSDKYMVEGTWQIYTPNVVYFSNKKVAEDCLNKYKHLIKKVVEVEQLKGYIFNNKELAESELCELDTKVKRMIKSGLI